MVRVSLGVNFFFLCYGDHLDLHVMTLSFPTRRSSDLPGRRNAGRRADRAGDGRRHQGDRPDTRCVRILDRSEEHTSELQSLMRISYAVFCLKKKNKIQLKNNINVLHLSTSTLYYIDQTL